MKTKPEMRTVTFKAPLELIMRLQLFLEQDQASNQSGVIRAAIDHYLKTFNPRRTTKEE